MANKLKDMLYKSVDLVRRGANPDADIKLYKSLDGVNVIMKSADEIEEMINKSLTVIDGYTDMLKKSLTSIVSDDDLSEEEARDMMAKSIAEFNEAMLDDVIKEYSYTQEIEKEDEEEYTEDDGEDEMDELDTSRLTKEENEQLEALLSKAYGKIKKEDLPEVEIEDDGEEEDLEKEGEEIIDEETMKSMHPAVAKALEKMDTLEKSLEMKSLEEIAKKYETLGENTEELAKTLYEMKKQGEGVYKSYISILDKSLALVEKSGVFTEIGKSSRGTSAGDVVGKIESIATEIQKSNPTYTRQQAINKAWENNPDLAYEYESGRL